MKFVLKPVFYIIFENFCILFTIFFLGLLLEIEMNWIEFAYKQQCHLLHILCKLLLQSKTADFSSQNVNMQIGEQIKLYVYDGTAVLTGNK